MTKFMKLMRLVLMTPVVVTALAFGGGPPELEITRSTIDGGGIMRSTGGDLELSGTIGQPEAGIMSNGDLQLSGGFWFTLPPGDCNDDGSINLLDHRVFESCLTGPDAFVGFACRCFDIDQTDTVDLLDAVQLQLMFTGP